MSELIIINDIFHELKHENNRLLNDLIKCQKYKQLIEKYRKTFGLIQNNCKCNQNSYNELIFELLENEYKNIDNNGCIDTNITQTLHQNIPYIKSLENINSFNNRNELNNENAIEINEKTINENEVKTSPRNEELIESKTDYEITDNELSDEDCDDFNQTNSVSINENHNRLNTNVKSEPEIYKCDSIGCSFETHCELTFIEHKNTDCQFVNQSSNRVIYKCNLNGCLFETKNKQNLNRHKHIYDETAFMCTYSGCERGFDTKSSLYRHLRRKHINQVSDTVDQDFNLTLDDMNSNSINENTFDNNNESNTGENSSLNSYKRDFDYFTRTVGLEISSTDSNTVDNNNTSNISEESVIKLYKCDFNGCLFETKWPSNLTYHKRLHNCKEFRCDYPGCDRVFSILRYLKRHIIDKHKGTFDVNKYIINIDCTSKSTSHSTYKCDYSGCHFESIHKSNFNSHKLLHEKRYPCAWPECERVFSNQWFLKRHVNDDHVVNVGKSKPIIRKTSNTLHKCDFIGCNFETKWPSNMKNHKLLHERQTCFCDWPECKGVFTAEIYLKRHLKASHNGKQYKDIYLPEKPKLITHKCDFIGCNFETKWPANLKNHKRLHEDRKYHCEWPGCQREFIQLRYLNKHMISHTDPECRPFRCDYPGCEKAYKDKCVLVIHKRTHTGEKPFKCNWNDCNRSFNDISQLILHKKRHRNDNYFTCDWPECGKRYDRLYVLRQHMKTHQNNDQLICSFDGCNQKFNTKRQLGVHYWRVH